MKFIYRDRSDDQYEKRARQRSGASRDTIFKDFVKIFIPRVDEINRIRILPPTWDNPEHYGYDVWVHYGIGANNSAYLCNRLMQKGNCPICDELSSKSALADPVYAKKLKAKRKVVVYIIDRKEEEAGPKVWAMPWQLDKTFVIQSWEEETGSILRIDHPEDGYDVSFNTVKGATKDVAFTYEGEKIARRPSPITTDPALMDKILDYIVQHPIPSVLDFKDPRYIEAVFKGTINQEDVPEEEEDLPLVPKGTEEITPPKDIEEERVELESYAIEQLGMKYKDVVKMDIEKLRSLVEENKEDASKKEESPVDDKLDKLAKLREKYRK